LYVNPGVSRSTCTATTNCVARFTYCRRLSMRNQALRLANALLRL
jgi:hypothetical protein